MPLKPIYGKSPLTDLVAVALRPGQVQIANEKMQALCNLVNASQQVACWEGAIRLSSVVGIDEVPAEAYTRAAMEKQEEDGGFAVQPVDAIAICRAAFALYEQYAERPMLEKLLKFCGWLNTNWDCVMAEQRIRTSSADLMELLVNLYRITGKKGLLALCEKLRKQSLSWSGVLHTFAVQRPMSRVTAWEDMQAGMLAEGNQEDGFYTRQYITCHGVHLADGVRSSAVNAVYSGNGTEMEAAKVGWERIKRYHGAICGGIASDELIAGSSPSAAVDAASLGAWAEAFAMQGELSESAWAFDSLQTLLENGMAAALQQGKLVAYQRVNSLSAQPALADCYHLSEESEHDIAVLARMSRGYASAISHAVMTTKEGLIVNLYHEGTYALPVDGKVVRLTVNGKDGKYTIQVNGKQSVHAKVQLRIPVWTDDAYIRINQEGGDEGKPGTYLTLERDWNNGDKITVEFAQNLRLGKGYHQGVYVMQGATVFAAKADADWAYAITEAPVLENGKVLVPAKVVDGWRKKGDAPVDLPVLPEMVGDTVMLELTPYAETPCRIAMFPQGAKA